MKQRRQFSLPLSNNKPKEPAKVGTKAPTPLNDAELKHVAGGNSLPVKGW